MTLNDQDRMNTEVVTEKKKSSWCSKSTSLPVNSFRLETWGIDVTLKSEIESIHTSWDKLTPDESFARSKYLKTLELTNPDHLKNLYVILSKDGQEIGAILLQSLVLKLAQSFDYDNYTTNRSFFSRLWQKFRQLMISFITFRMITVGNLYLTGQYGLHLNGQGYSKEEIYTITQDLLHQLRKELRRTEYRFSGVLYKDFFEEKTTTNAAKLGLYPFKIDPNMILKMRPSWNSFDDYLLDMKSKYRVRLKNAMKKFGPIERRVLSLADVQVHNAKMYELYNLILDGSGFVLAKGNENYFLELKKQLGDDLHVEGYFLEGKLIGFFTWVMEGTKMDSHFIGFDTSINNKYQIYLNILLDLVKAAITQKSESLYYFRTALEIKSSVGSEPHDMTCYFQMSNSFLNKFVPISFKYFVPQQSWKQRHPFKG